jgi:hypothetical protein
MENRESGYYWVKIEGEEWGIALYNSHDNTWEVIGDPFPYADKIFKIDERRIERDLIMVDNEIEECEHDFRDETETMMICVKCGEAVTYIMN